MHNTLHSNKNYVKYADSVNKQGRGITYTGDTCTGFPSRPIAMQLHLSMHTLIGVKTGWEGRSKYFAWFVYTTKEKSGVRSTFF